MVKKAGQICMMLGVFLAISGIYLHLYNRAEDTAAASASADVMPRILEQIESGQVQTSAAQMVHTEIDGNPYIGYLTIPALGLELPVMDNWDYSRLKLSPCRYTGSLWEENLVIMAHNYSHHFGRLSALEAGDSVFFVDMNGLTTQYRVAVTDILNPTAVEDVVQSGYDLTLFTCTYGGKSRVAVFCNKMIQ